MAPIAHNQALVHLEYESGYSGTGVAIEQPHTPSPTDQPRNEGDATNNLIESFFRPKFPTIHYDEPSSTTVSPTEANELIQASINRYISSLETSIDNSTNQVKSVLKSIYALEKNGHERSASQEIMFYIESNLKENKLVETNLLLAMADTSQLNSKALIGLIRSTARVRTLLPAWDRAYIASRKRITRIGKNPDALFIGLPLPKSA